jgi:hypothetical protein
MVRLLALIADGPGTPVDVGVSTFLMVGALVLALLGVTRLRGTGFRRMPRAGAWGAMAGAAACVVLAVVLPPIIRPVPQDVRPSTVARLEILSPRPGQRISGSPATVSVRLRLVGGRIVPITSRNLIPNAGHIHVFLDGLLVSMTFGLEQDLSVKPGDHMVSAAFVAVDHAPFNPPVTAQVRFRVISGPG